VLIKANPALCRVEAIEQQVDEYHDAEKCRDNDEDAGQPLLQENVEGRREESTTNNSACASGCCDKQYWICPGNAGFKV